MMLAHHLSRPLCLALALAAPLPAAALAADLSCNGLLETGQTLICSGFEPNWALELSCDGGMNSSFIDAFSGDGIQTTPGSVSFASENPWQLQTSHPVTGSIAYTPPTNLSGSDEFTYTLTNDDNTVTTATVLVCIEPVIATNQTITGTPAMPSSSRSVTHRPVFPEPVMPKHTA